MVVAQGVFSVAFFPVAFGYLVLSWFGLANLEVVRLGLGLVATALAWITVFSTGMIYGCLKTIRQWEYTAGAGELSGAGEFFRCLDAAGGGGVGGLSCNRSLIWRAAC